MPDVWQWMCHYCINNLGLSRLEFEHPTFRLRGEQSNTLRHRFKKYFFLFTVHVERHVSSMNMEEYDALIPLISLNLRFNSVTSQNPNQ